MATGRRHCASFSGKSKIDYSELIDDMNATAFYIYPKYPPYNHPPSLPQVIDQRLRLSFFYTMLLHQKDEIEGGGTLCDEILCSYLVRLLHNFLWLGQLL